MAKCNTCNGRGFIDIPQTGTKRKFTYPCTNNKCPVTRKMPGKRKPDPKDKK